MKPLPLALALALVTTVAVAQGTNTGTNTPPANTGAPGRPIIDALGDPPSTLPATPEPNASRGTNATPGASMMNRNTGTAAAGGNDNQAVATTNANAPQPAHGANSFSMGEARTRIAGHGFQTVSNLHKDKNGVWRGKAMKDGQPVSVWLDYKGNVGERQ
jgi:hypothetical protein